MNYSLLLFFMSYLMTPKFCINCMYFVPNEKYLEYSKCAKFPINENDDKFLVTGEVLFKNIEYHHCSTARKLDHLCSVKGKFHHTVSDILL